MARKFFYVCAGLFLLAMTYHLGAKNASAQFGGSIAGVTFNDQRLIVVTANGDVFSRVLTSTSDGGANYGGFPTLAVGNYWGSGPTPTAPSTLGSIKARYR